MKEQNSALAPLEPMAAFFESRLDGYDQHMLTEIEGADEFYPYTAAQLPLDAHISILDLGCGTGLELEAYMSRCRRNTPVIRPRVVGIDLSAGMLAALRQKFTSEEMDLTLLCGSYFELPLGEEQYDAAVSVESLHHFTAAQKQTLYARVCRALKADGVLIVTDYFASDEEMETRLFHEYLCRIQAMAAKDGELYHFDTPLTVEHEMEAMRRAGFERVQMLARWGNTATLLARRT